MWELGWSFGSLDHPVEGVGNNVGGMDVEKWEDGEMGGGSKVGRGTCGSWDGAVASHLPPHCCSPAPGLGPRFPTHSKYSQFRQLPKYPPFWTLEILSN